ncbi:MAG: galactokinase [Ruminococcaceae bacterium]|nr:galactokinase [Oscillospiraceae bacterium]
MNTKELKRALLDGAYDNRFAFIYGEDAVSAQKARYAAAIDSFAELYGETREAALYSVAGRSEISGNHTDHNHGCVIAASIDLDIIAVAAPNNDGIIRVKSEGFDEDVVDLSVYTAPKENIEGHSEELIAGVAAGFRQNGYKVGGFDAYTTSNVLKGSGISSSAAFEDMIGNILSHLYNDGQIDNVEIAKISQYAENVFFGKPCGLMDQVACAVGGIVGIDFADPKAPVIEKLDFDMSAAGYKLCIVNTGGNHADLTDDYASVPAEMKAVAKALGKSVLREADEKDVIAAIPTLRKTVGDRAILRALHFYAENRRVKELTAALKRNDLDAFLSGILASGRSSFCYLQNVYTTKNLTEQGLSLALCLSDTTLSGKRAAWRVHGGGFAGTIQAFVPDSETENFRKVMDAALGEGCCMVRRIRPVGAVKI